MKHYNHIKALVCFAGCLIPSILLAADEPKATEPEPTATTPDAAYAAIQTAIAEQPAGNLAGDLAAAWKIAHARRIASLAKRFYRDFPGDERRWAMLMDTYTANIGRARADGTELAEARALISTALAEKNIPAGATPKGELWQIDDMLAVAANAQSCGLAPNLAAIRSKLDEFSLHPTKGNTVVSRELRYINLLKLQDVSAAESWIGTLSTSKIPEVAEIFQGRQRLIDMRKQPLDLKFTAIDGREVDVAQLRGKVVLLDFWATWCGPCKAELPNLKAIYKKYHPLGFEVVGISLDRPHTREKVLAFLQQNEMPWPQFYPGDSGKNELATRFGAYVIPMALLLNKEGLLVCDNALGETLEKEVKKCLGE